MGRGNRRARQGSKQQQVGEGSRSSQQQEVGKVLLLRYCYSEILGIFQVPPRDQGKTLQQIIGSDEFSKHVAETIDPEKSGIGEAVEMKVEAIPHIEEGETVVQFAEKGGYVMFHPNEESKEGDGLACNQAIKYQQLMNSSDYVDFLATKLESMEKGKGEEKVESNVQEESMEATVQRLVASLTDIHNTVTDLKTENKDLRTELKDLRTEVADLKTEVADLKTENSKLKKQVHGLLQFARPYQLVVIRKLLDKFRDRAKSDCWGAGLNVPNDWNQIALLTSPDGRACAGHLQLDARTLAISRYGEGSLQEQAGAFLHDLENDTWDKTVYATHIVLSTAEEKRQLGNIYRYIFDSNAVEDAWASVEWEQ